MMVLEYFKSGIEIGDCWIVAYSRILQPRTKQLNLQALKRPKSRTLNFFVWENSRHLIRFFDCKWFCGNIFSHTEACIDFKNSHSSASNVAKPSLFWHYQIKCQRHASFWKKNIAILKWQQFRHPKTKQEWVKLSKKTSGLLVGRIKQKSMLASNKFILQGKSTGHFLGLISTPAFPWALLVPWWHSTILFHTFQLATTIPGCWNNSHNFKRNTRRAKTTA